MAVKFAAWGNHQFVIPTTGAPASGYKLYTYVAGSSTLVTTYTTSAGSVAQSNPIVLNSAGFPTTGQIWITEGTSIKIDFTDASDVSIKVEDNIPGTNDATLTQDQWVSGPAPTYVSATSFTLAGDQTSDFHVGRRLKTTNTAGTIYSRISATAYTTLTTVTVVNDSGTLDSGLSAVNYGLLTATNFSIPRLTETNKRILDLPGLADENTWTGLQTMSGKSMYWAKGADIVSAATLVLGTDGNMFDVTGSTGPITAITVPAGMLFMLQFDSTPTLTHGANLRLPNATSITAVAGMKLIGFATAANSVEVLSCTPRPGEILQVVHYDTAAVATGTTVLPFDDTIPQNTEGDQYMTLAITPKSATSNLVVDVVFFGSLSTVTNSMSVALFRDSTADALGAGVTDNTNASIPSCVAFSVKTPSNSTNETTFKVRAGKPDAGTTTFNGGGGGRKFGGVISSSIRITEIAA